MQHHFVKRRLRGPIVKERNRGIALRINTSIGPFRVI